MSTQELRPCPFCGGVVILKGDDLPYVVPSGTVVCDDCGAQGHADFWNRRSPVTQGSVVVPECEECEKTKLILHASATKLEALQKDAEHWKRMYERDQNANAYRQSALGD